MKRYNGKAIYNPSGKAGEYAKWACNFHVGCSNGCEYCYCKKGLLAHAMGGEQSTLKKCFQSDQHAIDTFESELYKNLDECRKHGIFFSFTTDPLLPETRDLTFFAVRRASEFDVPVKILSKRADGALYLAERFKRDIEYSLKERQRIAFGFTLTGHDELEQGASTNAERIEAMRELHNAGFRTFASIEPIVDFASSRHMIESTLDVCDLYKIGLMSGKKYPRKDLCDFFYAINQLKQARIYWKDSVLNALKFERSSFEFDGFENCVSADYNLFNQ